MSTDIALIRIRSSARYKRICRVRRAQAELDQDPCAICNMEIDYDAEPRTTLSWTLDHVIPLSVDITLAYEPTNHQSAHYGCNSSRGADPTWASTEATIREPVSIDW